MGMPLNQRICFFMMLQHQGLGLDLRRRKIWDFFGGNFNLQVTINLIKTDTQSIIFL